MEEYEDRFEIENIVKDFYYEKLKFCGCGCPGDTLLFIKKLLNLIETKFNKNLSYEAYQKEKIMMFQFQDKSTDKTYFSDIQQGIIQFIYYHLDEVGILEHGSGIGGAWLTEYGKTVLSCLNQIPGDELEWII